MPFLATLGAGAIGAYRNFRGAGFSVLYVEDVFSTYLYTGNGTGQNITNGIELGPSTGGGSIYFDGTGDYLTFADNPSLELGSSDFTLEMWLNSAYGAADYVPICKSGTTVYQPFLIYINGTTNVALYIGDDSASWLTAGSLNVTVLTNQWSHVAFCRSGNTIRAFLNGELVDTLAFSSAVPNNGRDWYIGSRNYASTTNQGFDGYISNLRLVVGTALYTASFTPSTSPLTAVANTQLLIGQSPSPTTDYSINTFTANVVNAVASTTGPFPSGSSDGGLVWIKARSLNRNHTLYDTARGAIYELSSNLTTSQNTEPSGLTSFNTDGFTLGDTSQVNLNNQYYGSWTFRKKAKFFDVVTYTGNGANRTIGHNLGSVPGSIFVKRTDTTGEWQVYHRSLANTQYMVLNTLASSATGTNRWNSTSPTDTVFSLGTAATVNADGGTYVAYLFAHNAGGFGDTGTDNIISCGSFTTDVSENATVTLGWEPQWLLFKSSTDNTNNWTIRDNLRGFNSANNGASLQPNTNITETSPADIGAKATSTGFTMNAGSVSTSYIYIAIRRGPMKTPTNGTEVFQPIVYTGTNVDNRKVTTNILTDMIMARQRDVGTVAGFVVGDRLRADQYLLSGAGSAGVTDADALMTPTLGYGNSFSAMDGFGVGNDATSDLNSSTVANNQVVEAFRRAPGFLDIVTYTGTGSARTVSHNLGVAPEMIWVKCTTTGTRNWIVYSSFAGPAAYLNLNLNSDVTRGTLGEWNGTSPNTSVFTVGTDVETNNSGDSYVAYLMGSVPGVSKCSYYVGKGVGNVNQVDCGFTSGARFVIIKSLNRTGTAGNWFVYDAARGIVSGNDPYLWPHSTDAEVTNTDYIDTYANGFEISATAIDALNEGYADFWTAQADVLGAADITGIVYGDNLWVAGGSAGTIAYSSNAYSWTTVAGVVTGGVNQITYGNGLYVAVGGSGRISTSANAITWSTRTSGLSTTLTGVTYGLGKYWVVDSSGNLISSTDGITWSTVTTGLGFLIEIDFLNGNLIIVGGSGLIITSSDGITFTTRTSGTANDLRNATYANNLYVVVGDSGTILTSSDLVTWTARSAGALAGNNINDVVWASYRFIAVATAGEVGYSADGITWSTGNAAGGNPLISVAFANDILLTGNGDGDIYISDPKYIYWAIA
jgi:hypothetical protein